MPPASRTVPPRDGTWQPSEYEDSPPVPFAHSRARYGLEGSKIKIPPYLGRPPFDHISPTEARQQYRETRGALRPPAPDVSVVRDLRPGAQTGVEADLQVGLRLYRPADGVLPALIYFHGGGWVVGDLDTHDGFCRALARSSGARVLSLEYRLAPEHPFPAAVEAASPSAATVRVPVSRRSSR